MAKRLVAKVGEYTKDGQTKGEYVNLGVILNSDNGEFMLLDPAVSLAGTLTRQNIYARSQNKKIGDKVLVSIFDSNHTGQQGGHSQPQSQPQANTSAQGNGNPDPMDDDIPF